MARLKGRAEVWEGEHIDILDRIVLKDGTALVDTDLSGPVELFVYLEGAEQDSGAVLSVVQSSLIVDGSWTVDAIGYNFKHTLDTEALPLRGGRRYRLEYVIPVTGQGNKYVVFELAVLEVISQVTSE